MSSRPLVPDKTSPSRQLRPGKSLLHQHPHDASPTHLNGGDADPDPDLNPKLLAVTGRSRTTPEALNTLWTTTVHSPQLSERDSIFATTYSSTPPASSSSASPSQPVTIRARRKHDDPQEEDDMPVPARPADREVTGLASTTTPLPIPKHPVSILKRSENRHFDKPRHAIGIAESRSRKLRSNQTDRSGVPMGQSTDAVALPPGLSPAGSPFERPSTPLGKPAHVSFNEDDVDKEQRVLYRAWREGKASMDGKLLSGKPRGSISNHRHVDKKIEATLPRTDTPATAARSRKASQYLGLFKEKDAAEELRRLKERSREQSESVRTLDPWIKAKNQHPIKGDMQDGGHSDDKTPIASRMSLTDLHEHSNSGKGSGTMIFPQNIFNEVFFPKSDSNRASIEAEIAIGQDLQFSHSVPAGDLRLAEAEIHKWRDQNLGHFMSQPSQLAPEDDEDSEPERISSALYFPHRQVLPEALSQDEHGSTANVEKNETAVDDIQYDETQRDAEERISRSPEEVEISLQSQDDQSCWHGDLRKDSSSTEEPEQYSSTNEAPATSSESDYDSVEGSQSEYGYESSANEGLESTATSKQRRPSQAIRKHRHEYDIQNPVGAVKLKPYNHQVGGHSTVYRFSRRAVCKQLNNRENEFYETVERFHPELLEFLPR